MFSIRKFVGYSATVIGLGAIFVLAFAPQPGLAAGSSSKPHELASVPRAAAHAATPPSTSCTAAKQALATAMANDKVEDTAERAAQKTKPDKTAAQAEDKTEHAAMKVLSDAVGKACAPPVTAQCSTARQALDAANAKDAIEDATEKTKPAKTEDAAEQAAVKPLRDAVRAACEPQKPAPSAACVAAKQALKTAKDQDRAEDQAEKASKTSPDTDKTEDKTEHDSTRLLHDAVRTACGPDRHGNHR